jgi:hypothetical protein
VIPDYPITQIQPPADLRGRDVEAAYQRGAYAQASGRPMDSMDWQRAHGYEANADAYERGYADSAHDRLVIKPMTNRQRERWEHGHMVTPVYRWR